MNIRGIFEERKRIKKCKNKYSRKTRMIPN